ncbi:DUF2972 domain-containing protein [Helicobacter sp. T3_23-1056]
MNNVKITHGGGQKLSSTIKSYRKAYLARIIKDFKRCYFGKPLIKMLGYSLLGRKQKAQKWRERHTIRAQNLRKSIRIFNLIQQITAWVESSDFKEKYIDTNHPYPPLLNPDSIDYESISADLAWDMNLPLPRGYKFLCIMASFNGHTAMVLGLKKCGVCIMGDHIGDIKDHYIYNYTNLLQGKFVAINITAYTANSVYFRELEKLILMTDKGTPILMLVRDPISRLKSSLNNSWGKCDLQNSYDDFTLPCNALENRIYYHISLDLSIVGRIAQSVKFNTFAYATLYEFLCKFGFDKIDVLDISSIEPSKAFETFCKLACQYGFAPPKNRDFLPRVHIQEFCGFLPLKYSIQGDTFLITQDKQDSMREIDLGIKKSGIYIYAENAKISQYAKEKLAKFVDKLIEMIEIENKYHKINENDLIMLLECESTALNFMREILQKEAKFVKELRPDVVKSWKYYNKFEKMCAESNITKD